MAITHYLIRWKGWAPEYDTWEPVKNMTGAPEAIKQYLEEQQIELNS
jgi:hypothetical protein